MRKTNKRKNDLKVVTLFDFTRLLKIASSNEFSKPLLELCLTYSHWNGVTYMSSQTY